ncbi:MAG: hypothetical protein V1484_00185 [bacterium]
MNQNEKFIILNEETKEVNEILDICKKTLKDDFGVDNLTNIEIFNLRKSIEQNLENNKNANNSYQTIPVSEPWIQFLFHYGIDIYEILKIKDKNIVRLLEDKPLMEYIKRTLKKAREENHKPYLD